MTTHIRFQQGRFHRGWALALGALLVSASAFAIDADPSSSTIEQAARPLTRAEVIADFNLWRRAGAEQRAEAARYYQVDAAAYERALAEYRRLRTGPAFAQEVARVQGQASVSTHADAR